MSDIGGLGVSAGTRREGGFVAFERACAPIGEGSDCDKVFLQEIFLEILHSLRITSP